MIWHACPVINTGGVEDKQMGLSVRSVLPPLIYVFHSVEALNVSWCELSFNTSPPLPALLLLLNSASLLKSLSLSSSQLSLSVTHTQCPSPPVSVPTHTPSRSLQRVLPDSGLLCTVQSSVYESLTTVQTYCTSLPQCIPTRSHYTVVSGCKRYKIDSSCANCRIKL